VELGREFSLVDDPAYPKDPAVTAALKRLEPTAVPLMCRWVFLAPADQQTGVREELIFKRHGIGRVDMALQTEGRTDQDLVESEQALRLNNLEVPPGWIGGIPRYLDPTVGVLDDPGFLGLPRVSDDPRETYKTPDLPGPYVPWDWALLRALERMHTVDHTTEQLIQRVVTGPLERRKARGQRMHADFGAAMLDFQRWADRKVETASTDEVARQLALSQERSRQARIKRMREQHSFKFKLHGVS
jgi:hypothetical protein